MYYQRAVGRARRCGSRKAYAGDIEGDFQESLAAIHCMGHRTQPQQGQPLDGRPADFDLEGLAVAYLVGRGTDVRTVAPEQIRGPEDLPVAVNMFRRQVGVVWPVLAAARTEHRAVG